MKKLDTRQLVLKYKDEFLQNLSEIIAIPSLRDDSTKGPMAPFGQACKEALDWFLAKGKQDGFEVENVDGYAGLVSYGKGPESFSLLGHLDVVPVDASEWDTNPFELVEKDGILFGRGTLDDKGPAMAAYMALKILKDQGISLRKKVMVICGVDEESGMDCMHYFRDHHTLPDQGIVPDADFPLVYGEKGILNMQVVTPGSSRVLSFDAGSRPNVVIGKATGRIQGPAKEKEFAAYLRAFNLTGEMKDLGDEVEVTIYGKNFHGSMPHKGINAGLHWLNFVGTYYDDDLCLNLYRLGANPFGQGLGIDYDGAYMGPLTVNVGIIHLNQKQGRIYFDIRYPNELDGLALRPTIEKHLKTVSGVIDQYKNSKPHFVDPKGSLVTSCMEVYQDVTGDNYSPAKTMGGGTYARTLPNHVAFGADFPDKRPLGVGGPHEKNEGMPLESLLVAMEIYLRLLLKVAAE